MNRSRPNRSVNRPVNRLVVTAVLAALGLAALPAAADFASGRLPANCHAAQSGSAAIPAALASRDDDAIRLARACRDLIAAEQALRENPAAAASFGSMLREARATLDTGLAAVSEQTRIAILPPASAARALDTANPRPAANPTSSLRLRRWIKAQRQLSV